MGNYCIKTGYTFFPQNSGPPDSNRGDKGQEDHKAKFGANMESKVRDKMIHLGALTGRCSFC